MGRENYSSGKGKKKKNFFSFKIEISYPDKLSCIILHMKKGNEDGKNHITFSVESINHLLNNSMDYHTDSVFYLLNYGKSVVKFYLGIKIVLY